MSGYKPILGPNFFPNFTETVGLPVRARQRRDLFEIAESVGVSIRTVQRYLKYPSCPVRPKRSDFGKSLIDPYKDYLLQQWNGGCHSPNQLLAKLRQQGYGGSLMTLERYLRRLRQPSGIPSNHRPRRKSSGQAKVVSLKVPRLTANTAAWLVARRQENLHSQEELLLRLLKNHNVLFSQTIQLAEQFLKLLRERLAEKFDDWLTDATNSGKVPWGDFALSLQDDYEAVKAAMTLPISNGQVEGQINRLKTLKRQMYGRAGIELLNRRYVLAL